jgi:hypothetical protein
MIPCYIVLDTIRARSRRWCSGVGVVFEGARGGEVLKAACGRLVDVRGEGAIKVVVFIVKSWHQVVVVVVVVVHSVQ